MLLYIVLLLLPVLLPLLLSLHPQPRVKKNLGLSRLTFLTVDTTLCQTQKSDISWRSQQRRFKDGEEEEDTKHQSPSALTG